MNDKDKLQPVEVEANLGDAAIWYEWRDSLTSPLSRRWRARYEEMGQ